MKKGLFIEETVFGLDRTCLQPCPAFQRSWINPRRQNCHDLYRP